MKKSNQKGAILGIVLICMLVLTILGYGFLHLSYTNAMQVDNTVRSNQALWLAEAGLQYAANDLSGAQGSIGVSSVLPDSAGSKSNGSYTITSITGTAPRWEITSRGTVNTISRVVKAELGPNVGGGINFYGDGTVVNPDHVNGPVKYNTGFTFENVFGLSRDSLYNQAYYPINKMDVVHTDKPIVWWNEEERGTLHLSGNSTGGGLLVIEGDLRLTGTLTFNGIIWVTGKVYGGGNLTVNGAIFIGGTLDINMGNSQINYDPAYVDPAIPPNPNLPLTLLNWHEVHS